MPDSLQHVVLQLIGAALKNEPALLPENTDWNAVFRQSKRHHVVNLILSGIAICNASAETAEENEFFLYGCAELARHEAQLRELDILYRLFEENGIEYMPLKGAVVKPLYPSPEWRSMSDADILIREEQYDRVRPIMLSLGYSEETESDHEYIWDKPNALHLELHKRVIPSYNADYYAYFGDGWSRAHRVGKSCRFQFTDEDLFVYLFAHMAKHYRDGGIGLKHITDLYVYRNVRSHMDEAYIEQQMKELQLHRFYVNILRLLRVWFEEGDDDPVTDTITDAVFQSGAYGTRSKHLLSGAVREAELSGSSRCVERGKWCRILFPSYLYPTLKRIPMLLPFAWIHRGVSLIPHPAKLRKRMDEVNRLTAEAVDSYRESLRYVGLDFYLKE